MKWNEAERKNETSNAEIDHRNANNTINIVLSCSVGANSSVEAKLVFGGYARNIASSIRAPRVMIIEW